MLSIIASALTQRYHVPGEDMRVAALVAIAARRDYGAHPKGQPLAKSHERALNETSRACVAASSGGSSLPDMQASPADDDGWGAESAARAAYTAPHMPMSSSTHAGSSSMLAGSGFLASSTSMGTEGLQSRANAALNAQQISHLSADVLQLPMQSRHDPLHSLSSSVAPPRHLLRQANMLEHNSSDLHGSLNCISLPANQAQEQLTEQRQHEIQQCHQASRGVPEAAPVSNGDMGEEPICKGAWGAGRPSGPTSNVDSALVKLSKLQQASTSSCREAGTDREFVQGTVQSSAEPSDENAISAPLGAQGASCQSVLLSELERLERMKVSGQHQAAPQWVSQSPEDVSADMLLARKLQDEELRWHQMHSRVSAAQTLKRKLKKETTLDAFLKKPALGRK